MSKAETVPVQKSQSIADEIDRLNQRIMRRAFELFERSGGMFGSELDNWLSAESELVWKPPIELSEKDNEMLLSIAVPGVEPTAIEIEATPEDLVVKAEMRHEHLAERGSVYTCELHSGDMFRTIHFPKRIDPDKVKAEFKNGMLTIHAPVSAEHRIRNVSIDAA